MKKGKCCGPQATCMTGTSAKTKEEHERLEKELAAVKDRHPKEIKEKQVAFERQEEGTGEDAGGREDEYFWSAGT